MTLLTEKAMAAHSSTLAWKIPWTEESGRLQSMGSSRVGHVKSWSDFTFTFHFHVLEKEMATHSSVPAWRIPGNGGAWWAAVYGVAQSRTRLTWLSSTDCASASRKYTAVWVVIHQVHCGFWTQAPEGIYNRRVCIFILLVNQAQWPPYLGP